MAEDLDDDFGSFDIDEDNVEPLFGDGLDDPPPLPPPMPSLSQIRSNHTALGPLPGTTGGTGGAGGGGAGGGAPQPQDGSQGPPVKKRKPLLTLTTDRCVTNGIFSDKGLPYLEMEFPKLKFKGKGHEASDLKFLMKQYEMWANRLYPKYTFKDVLKRIERLSTTKEFKSHLFTMRRRHVPGGDRGTSPDGSPPPSSGSPPTGNPGGTATPPDGSPPTGNPGGTATPPDGSPPTGNPGGMATPPDGSPPPSSGSPPTGNPGGMATPPDGSPPPSSGPSPTGGTATPPDGSPATPALPDLSQATSTLSDLSQAALTLPNPSQATPTLSDISQAIPLSDPSQTLPGVSQATPTLPDSLDLNSIEDVPGHDTWDIDEPEWSSP